MSNPSYLPNLQESVTEEDVIQNSRLEHLYNHEFKEGRFFQVVFADEDQTHIQLAPRTLMKVVYVKDKNDIEGIEIVKTVWGKDKERVKFSKFNLQQLTMFLKFISSIDLQGISERRITLADDALDILDAQTKRKVGQFHHGGDLTQAWRKSAHFT